MMGHRWLPHAMNIVGLWTGVLSSWIRVIRIIRVIRVIRGQLISACGALIFSTATRMGRVIDRVRYLSARFEEVVKHPETDDMATERLPLLQAQLERQTVRARLIQRSMVAFYSALGIFVATSLAIAVLNSVARNYLWVSVVLGLIGSSFMLYGSVLLIIESRMALAAVTSELEFLSKVARKYAPAKAGALAPPHH